MCSIQEKAEQKVPIIEDYLINKCKGMKLKKAAINAKFSLGLHESTRVWALLGLNGKFKIDYHWIQIPKQVIDPVAHQALNA